MDSDASWNAADNLMETLHFSWKMKTWKNELSIFWAKTHFFIFEMVWIFDGDRGIEFLMFRFLRAFSPTNAESALRNEWNTPNNEDNEWAKLAKDKK